MSDTDVPSGTFGDYSGSNADAETDDTKYDICQRSGKKAKTEDLAREWTGLMVLPKYLDHRHPQELQTPNRESYDIDEGYATNVSDTFISGTVTLIAAENGDLIQQETGDFLETENSNPISADSL